MAEKVLAVRLSDGVQANPVTDDSGRWDVKIGAVGSGVAVGLPSVAAITTAADAAVATTTAVAITSTTSKTYSLIANTGTVPLRLAYGATATASKGIVLNPGSAHELFTGGCVIVASVYNPSGTTAGAVSVTFGV